MASSSPRSAYRKRAAVVVVLAVILGILHQDFWWWHDQTAVFGFMPIGLAYHALYSLMAAGLWAGVCFFAWPDHIEAMPETDES